MGTILLMFLLLVGASLWQKKAAVKTVPVTVNQTIRSADYDLAFSYPSGESGLAMIEPPAAGHPFAKAYLLIPTTDYIAFQSTSTPPGTPAPPAISIFVYPKPEKTDGTADLSRMDRLRVWAEENTAITSFAFATSEVTEINIDGLTALSYSADGLYQQTVYLALFGDHIYLFVGQYQDDTDELRFMFKALMDSVEIG